MKVLVTGAAGFIGANLCRELADRPSIEHVIAIDDLSTGSADNLAHVEAEFVKGSILDRSLLDDAVEAVDAVIHLAALPSVPRSLADPLRTYEVNATGTLQVLEACRPKSAYLVAASSSSVYGAARTSPKHEDLPTRPLSPYAASKIAAEASVLAYGAAFGLPILALRFFNVYGPLQRAGHPYAAVIPTFIDAALRGKPLVIHGDGGQVRDFTFVGAAVKVLADAVTRRVTRAAPVNLAFGTRTSITELASLIAAAAGVNPDIQHGPARPGDVPDSQADGSLLREMFPHIQPLGLAEGIAETVSWLRESGNRKIHAGTEDTRAEPAGTGI
jgi:UDP-glucose 4-epimerase